MLKIRQFVFSIFDVNTYLAIDVATNKAAVIDPAMSMIEEQKRFEDYVLENNVDIVEIINTHLHLDHCFGENYVIDKYGVKVAAHLNDAPLGNNMAMQYAKFGLRAKAKDIEIDVDLKDGDIIEIGESRLQVLHTPGHTPGGISLYDAEDKVIFTGDTLFNNSVGRTDLPGGNFDTLSNSIRQKLFTLPDDATVLPGHGEATTIGWEKQHNPYV